MVLPVNMAAIDNMGGQFKHNIFKPLSKNRAVLAAMKRNTGTTVSGGGSNFRNLTPQWGTRPVIGALGPGSTSTPAALPGAGRKALPAGTTRALPPGQTKAPAGGFATPYTAGATPHSNTGANRAALPPGRYRGIATPYQGGNRVIPMSSNAALTNRVNPNVAFSHTPQAQTPVNRTAFNPASANPFHSSAPSTPAATPGNTPQVHSTTQFSNVQPQSYPQHVHPAGSSQQILPNLSAAHSSPGKPQAFTVGSRNVKGGGIAAMGSQLEASLMSNPIGVPAKKRRV